jgi:Domain of unknown function (DUF4159)/Prenyltransferase and squalene oxidase repeat
MRFTQESVADEGYNYQYRSRHLSFTKQELTMSLRAACLTCCLSIVTILLNSPVCLGQNRGAKPIVVNPETVQKSIDRSVAFLMSGQKEDGGWDEVADYPGGVTSLVVLALLTAGLPPDHPKVVNGLNYLRQRVPKKTYNVALQSMAFCAANPSKFAAEIQRNTEWLLKAQCIDGSWSYGEGGNSGDPSNTQFALLALYEAQRAGAQLSSEEWRAVYGRSKRYWLSIRNKDGSFPYNASPLSTDVRGSMTCAGIASLVIVGSQLDGSEAWADNKINCCGQDASNDHEINAALRWLTANFTVHSNPGNLGQFHLYYLYGLERAGRMTGQRFLGDHDWYREGCEALMRIQESVSGKFDSAYPSLGNDYTETAFGLLFLAKGKRQVVINRLKFGKGEDWNHHSMAMQHLTSHTERAWKRDLAWQTIDLQKAKVADLLEAPVLFISASNAPVLTNESRELLSEYVKQGGFIFAEACDGDGCNGKAFDDYMRRFAADVLGKPLEKLSPDHPIWHAERSVDLKSLPENFWLYGVQSCCRLGLVYSPMPLSCRWELNIPYGARPNYEPKIQAELDNITLLGVNVLSYVTGKELKQKLQSILVLDEIKDLTPTDRGVFVLPQLQHNAAADDAPQAITNLIEWMGKENPFRMSSEHRLVPIVDEELQKYPLIFIHGRGELKFNEAQRSTLRNYLKNGGFIFADAICADEQFAASFRREMAVILSSELQPINEGHELLQGNRFSGFDIRQVSVIDPQKTKDHITANRRKISPQLELANLDDRVVVVFSPLDLSCALESRHSLQCRGYLRDDAARIGINAILFALQQ